MSINLKTFSLLLFLFFLTSIHGQTIFSNEGKYGLLDNSDTVAIKPTYDKIKQVFSPGRNYRRDNSVYILKKDDKYTFAFKKYSVKFFYKFFSGHSQVWEELDSNKWLVNDKWYDYLFEVGTIYNSKPSDNDYSLCLNKSITYHVLGYRIDGKDGIITYQENSCKYFSSHIKSKNFYSYTDLSKTQFTLDNLKIYPARYSSVSASNYNHYIITRTFDKYGLIDLDDDYELKPQFDSPPLQIGDQDFGRRYFYAKKNGLWGIIFLTKLENDFNIVVPFSLPSIEALKENLRFLPFNSKRITEEKNTISYNYGGEYILSSYNSSPNLPLQFEFVICEGEAYQQIIRDTITGLHKLNEKYLPQTEKFISFAPTIDNLPIIQQDDFEYLCVNNMDIVKSKDIYVKNSSAPLFFVMKFDRVKGTSNNDYLLDNRGKIIKDGAYSLEVEENPYKYEKNKNRRPRALAVYRLVNDTLISQAEFNDASENILYEVITDYLLYDISFVPRVQKIYESNLILKSYKIKNEGKSDSYKHAFFTLNGKKLYELESKRPIDYWEFVQVYNTSDLLHMTEDVFVLKFYTNTPGKKKEKEKIVCLYNLKTKAFSKY